MNPPILRDVSAEIKELLEKELGKKEPKDVFRKLFCSILNFDYANQIFSIEGVDELLDEPLVAIAKTTPPLGEGFYIFYGSMERIRKTARRKIVKKITEELSPFEEASFILILEDRKLKIWEIITYASLFGKLQLKIFRVGPGESHRTISENLSKLNLESPNITRTEVAGLIEEVFNVEPVTKEFYEKYKEVIDHLIDYLKSKYRKDLEMHAPAGVDINLFVHRSAKSFAHTLLNRLIFTIFLQKKGWIGGKKDFLAWLYENYGKYSSDFYGEYLRPLFLEVMNRPKNEKEEIVENLSLPPEVKEIYKEIMYFNGGLFNHLREFGVDIDEIITSFEDDNGRQIIGEIMEFLHSYNFTITEESPFEVEVAVDPAMLGYIYESLIAEQERGSAGIFYTPREEVDFMCRMALFNHLSKRFDKGIVMDILFRELDGNLRVPHQILDELEKIKIIDPASGSGAFLVGMFNVIREIYEKAGIRVDFERKRRIILENLHGVDVKEWAVRVAELRLWLALIEDEDNPPNFVPLLPNLTPNLRVGDSLVSEGIKIGDFVVGGVRIEGTPVALELKDKFFVNLKKYSGEIEKIKKEVFTGSKGVVELENKLVDIFIKALKEYGLQSYIDSDQIKDVEIKKIIDAYNEGKEIKIPFFWNIDFADVMRSGGFDIVIANPPYVRQENIYPEFFDPDELELLSVDRDKLKDAYKKAVIENTAKIVDTKISKRSDIYAYFFMKGIDILKGGGTLVFITSNSWLDVDYGAWMQEEFLKKTHLKFVIDYPHRTFEEADVNTIITVMERKGDIMLDSNAKVKFTKLKKSIGELKYEDFAEILGDIRDGTEVKVFGATVVSVDGRAARYRVVDEVNLAKLGGATETRTEQKRDKIIIPGYEGAKWGGILIRAPPIFYTILKKGEGKLVRLGEIAEVRFGIKTGANEFFYLEPIKNPDEWPVCEICGRVHRPDEGLVAVKNKAGWEGYIEEEFLRPVVKSPQEIKTYKIRLEDLKYEVFLCNLSKKELKNQDKKHALKYIEWGEKRKYHNNASITGRKLWWEVPKEMGDTFWGKELRQRIAVFFSDEKLFADCRLYVSSTSIKLKGILNSSLSYFIDEMLARQLGGGGGPRSIMVYELKNQILLNPKILDNYIRSHKLKNALNLIANREIKSIFEELGLPKPNKDFSNIKPEDVTLEGVMPDRRELDRIIFEALGLTEEEQLEVYRAVVSLVKERLVKAKKFGRWKK